MKTVAELLNNSNTTYFPLCMFNILRDNGYTVDFEYNSLTHKSGIRVRGNNKNRLYPSIKAAYKHLIG